jgi:LysR family transcriptional regulator, regulator for bpeEF and oprC
VLGSLAEEPADQELAESAGHLDLNLLMLFLEVVSAGSISRAAARLGAPKATLSRKLRQLEQQIGAVLVKRGPHRLEVTDIGQALLQRCERIHAQALEASQVASEMQSRLAGTMRVSMPFGVGNSWVSEALARFTVRYPDVKLTIHVTNRWVDVSEEPYDVAIHIGRVRNEQLPARRLAELARGLYASPEYCASKGVPLAPADLLHHECIVLESQQADGLWTISVPGQGAVDISPRLTTTDIIVAREMATRGIGIAMLTHAVCEAEVKTGRLVRVLPDYRLPPVVISAMFLERRHLPLRTRTFIDLMVEAVQAAQAAQVDPTR